MVHPVIYQPMDRHEKSWPQTELRLTGLPLSELRLSEMPRSEIPLGELRLSATEE